MDVKRLKAVMVGHAVGDALGVPVEFSSKEALDADPLRARFLVGHVRLFCS